MEAEYNLAAGRIKDILSFLKENDNLDQVPLYVLDVDETIFQIFSEHYRVWEYWIANVEWIKDLGVKSKDWNTFIEGGGSKVYQENFDSEEFNTLNGFNTHSPEFNQGLKLATDLEEVLEIIRPLIACYLTTRPESVKKVTSAELEKNNFPNPNRVICAGENGAYLGGPAFKLRKLQLMKVFFPNRKIILIDDDVRTCQVINEQNDPLMQAVIFEGAATSKKEYPEASSWKDVLKIIAQELEPFYSSVLLQMLSSLIL